MVENNDIPFLRKTSHNTVISALPNSLSYQELSVIAQGSGKQFEIILGLLEKIYEKVRKQNKHLVLLFDEPERGLHPKWEQEFSERLHQLTLIHPEDITIMLTTHAYYFLNYTNPDSNFLVYKEGIKNGDFNEIADALGYPYPIDNDVWKEVFTTNKDIFIVEGETDKAHVENCINLFPEELDPLFINYKIIDADGASNIKGLIKACKLLDKSINGFVDNYDAGKANTGKILKILPMVGAIETNTLKPKDFKTPVLEEKWNKCNEDRGNDILRKEYINIEKEQWKTHLSNLTTENPEEAKKHYTPLKEFLISTVFKK